jgi:hypothetical protein
VRKPRKTNPFASPMQPGIRLLPEKDRTGCCSMCGGNDANYEAPVMECLLVNGTYFRLGQRCGSWIGNFATREP